MLSAPMIRQIAPQFFTTEIAATLAYYKGKLGFDCLGTWDDPPVYAIVARDATEELQALDFPAEPFYFSVEIPRGSARR